MYCSLDKLDLAVALRGSELACFVQTDHRDADAIAAEAPLSVIFAIARCLGARAAAQASGRPFRVIYQVTGEVPAFLAAVIAAAGGTLARTVDDSLASTPELAPRLAELDHWLADACVQLAATTCERERLAPTLADLFAYERRYQHRSHRDDDEVEYYTRIVTLGALAAAVLMPHLDGASWRVAAGIVPFVLSGRRGDVEYLHVDVFGRAQRYVEHGYTDAVSALVAEVLGEPVGVTPLFAQLTPAQLEARALAGSPDDATARAAAASSARAAAAALRAWGLGVGDAVAWCEQPVRDTDLRPIGKPILERLAAAHRGCDGEHELYDALLPYREALDRAAARHGGFDGSRDDAGNAALFRSASALRLRLPDDGGPFANRQVAELPDPFAPLVEVRAAGYVVLSIDEHGVTLLVASRRQSD